MDKGIIYIVKATSDHSMVANEIVKEYHKAEVSYINASHFDKGNHQFIWDSCHQHTKLVVIDNVYATLQLKNLMYSYNVEKLVNRKHSPLFTINPRMILICDDHLLPNELLVNESVKRRFEIIDLSN